MRNGESAPNSSLSQEITQEPVIDPFEEHSIEATLRAQLEKLVKDRHYQMLGIRTKLSSQLLYQHGDNLQEKYDLPDLIALRVLLSPPPDPKLEHVSQEEQLADLLDHAAIILPDEAQITSSNLLGILIRSQLYETQQELLPIEFRETIGTASKEELQDKVDLKERLELIGSYYTALRSECPELPKEELAENCLPEYYRNRMQTIEAKRHELMDEHRRIEKLLASHQRNKLAEITQESLQALPLIEEIQE